MPKTALSIKERMEKLRGGFVEPKGDASPPSADRNDTTPISLKKLIPGQWIQRRGMKLFHLQERLPLKTRHGHFELASWFQPSYEGLALIVKEARAAGLDPQRTLFLDTETTGLAGGSGTVAFLVGCVTFGDDHLILDQFFIDDYPEEPLLLERLLEILERSQYLVTFNGKSYDQELLQARFRLHRYPTPFGKLAHLDLLHAARRIWKEAFLDCRLVTLENELLGFRRQNDIPGELIPRLYFDFLSTGNPAAIPGIFMHNRFDLLSLVGLAARLNQLYHRRDGGAMEKARLARLMKFAGRVEEAAVLWKEWVATSLRLDPFSYEELAKYYEHRMKNIGEALRVTEKALRLWRAEKLTYAQRDPQLEERLLHRLARLQRKFGGHNT